MTKAEIIALAERVERLDGASREVDAAIIEVRGYEIILDDRGLSYLYDPAVRMGRESVPFYTASLDAAMGLVPEGHDWVIGRTNGGLTIHAEVGGRGDEYMHFGNSPALALTCAALRAIAASMEDE